MPGYAAKSLDELPTLWDGFATLVRAGLDITAFGANIMDLPPDYATRSHDEADSGQQELYVALRGAGAVEIDGQKHPLDPEHLVRVDPGTERALSSGPEGLRVLCVGGVPGGAYEPPGWSSSGEQLPTRPIPTATASSTGEYRTARGEIVVRTEAGQLVVSLAR